MDWIDTVYHVCVDNVDERTRQWFLVDSFSSVLMILGTYLLFVTSLGPRYMQNREPYSLKRFIQFYDLFQIFINSYIVYLFLDAGWYRDIWIYCAPSLYTTDRNPMQIASTMWIIMIVKFIDLIETVIHVLRKKNNQISTLHLYHHISTVFVIWLSTRYIAVGMTAFVSIVNCSIHVFMYTYYFLATMGPKVQKIILPYKPMLTIVQMVQFVAVIIFSVQSLQPSCNVTKIPAPLMIINYIINFYLFYDFYKKTYKSPKTKRK